MITYHDIRHNEEVRALIEAGNEALGVLGYTDHGYAHAGLTAKVAGDLLETLGYDERTCELARIAGFMHDIGNAVNRTDHALSGAALAFPILRSLGMYVPPAGALAILPMLLPAERLPRYPLQIALGTALFLALALVLFRAPRESHAER